MSSGCSGCRGREGKLLFTGKEVFPLSPKPPHTFSRKAVRTTDGGITCSRWSQGWMENNGIYYIYLPTTLVISYFSAVFPLLTDKRNIQLSSKTLCCCVILTVLVIPPLRPTGAEYIAVGRTDLFLKGDGVRERGKLLFS